MEGCGDSRSPTPALARVSGPGVGRSRLAAYPMSKKGASSTMERPSTRQTGRRSSSDAITAWSRTSWFSR